MWVIIVNNTKYDFRDSNIGNILGDKIDESYLACSPKSKYAKFYKTFLISSAKIYKIENLAIKFIDTFNNSKNNLEFLQIKDKHLSYRKLRKDEWNSIIEFKINVEEYKFNSKKSILESKKLK